jgi:hypothetical protein
MKPITDKQYHKALLICQQYKAQQQGTPLKSFIEYNKHRMSRRLINILYKAIEIGHETVEELTERELMRINMCGVKTIVEFNELVKP